MPISPTTLNAIYTAKYTEVLGATNLLTLNTSALAATSLATPQSLSIAVLAADDVLEAFGQVDQLKETYPNFFIYAIVKWDSGSLYDLINAPFGFESLRMIATPDGMVVYIPSTANNIQQKKSDRAGVACGLSLSILQKIRSGSIARF
jgi:hypothetical protein